ncbi:MAG: hypothetical protein H3C62_09060 [Gemmatimonadaceae bacterium]|nr:hypothetical protein [Gemmatimonadaceae bacterium]
MSSVQNARRWLPAAALLLAGACGEDPRVVRARKAQAEVAATAQQVRTAPHAVPTGRWSQAQLTERLVNAGLAPRADDSIPSHPVLPVSPVALRVGKAHLVAWIFADSVARRTVSATIDTLTAIPKGQPNPFAEPPMFVMQNNLIAVLVGGSDRQRERVRLAIEAGLPVPH